MLGYLTPELRSLLPVALGEATAALMPALGRDFKETIVPTLVLVAPSGWSEGQSVAWQAAAAAELSGIPKDLLAIGCAAARRVADHPSKIIPEIHKAIGARWRDRRQDLARLRRIDDIASGRHQRKPWEPEPFDPAAAAEPAEVRKILAGIGIEPDEPRISRPTGPRRLPSDDDYRQIFGLTDEQIAAAREQERAEREAAIEAQRDAA